MIGMGDEVRRTQLGNNNAYCHDSEISWFDWSFLSKHADVYRFVKLLIERRLARDFENEYEGETLNQWLRESTKAWHGVRLNQPGLEQLVAWPSRWVPSSLAKDHLVHWILNAYGEPLDFELHQVATGQDANGRDGSTPAWMRRKTSFPGRTRARLQARFTGSVLTSSPSFIRRSAHPKSPNKLPRNPLLSFECRHCGEGA